MENEPWIAERRLLLVDRTTGERTSVTLRIALPVVSGDDAACRVEIQGLLENVKPVMGIDKIQALQEACKFLDDFLVAKSASFEVYWPTGETYSRLT